MEMRKCDYCGNEYDKSFFGTLDNGSEACFICIRDEEKRNETKSEINKEGIKNENFRFETISYQCNFNFYCYDGVNRNGGLFIEGANS